MDFYGFVNRLIFILLFVPMIVFYGFSWLIAGENFLENMDDFENRWLRG